jgi:hypothetical protein
MRQAIPYSKPTHHPHTRQQFSTNLTCPSVSWFPSFVTHPLHTPTPDRYDRGGGGGGRGVTRDGEEAAGPRSAERERQEGAVRGARGALPPRLRAPEGGQGDHLHQRRQPARPRPEAAHLSAPGPHR